MVKKLRHILYTIKKLFLELLFFLSSEAMWVAIDCRSKNWVAALKGLGTTALGDSDIAEFENS
jgi:hypothetical protein